MSLAAGVGETVAAGPLLLALLLALAAGALSFFSPCCLPLVPGYLSYVAGMTGANASGPADGRGTRWRVTVGGLLFVTGFAVVFTSYGALFGGAGATLLVHQRTLTVVLGAFTIALGLLFAGVLERLPLSGLSWRLKYRPRAGLLGAPVLGALFAIGWTPCIGPTLAAVLTLATDSASAGRGALLSFTYSLGLGVPFLVAAFSFDGAVRRFAFARRHARGVMRFGGALLVVVGVMEVTGWWGELIASMQSLISGFQLPL
ncbi:cytochrome c biogenesis CcdA family protein [Streptomyces sp. WAC00263]|uniref:cytochrome c biogenesis CcdA family protein n=1 Tax=Streptomyces sp. WAC00263 TaxID=1917422 RepID=UPI0009D5EB9B|nr:cytochrome c biogenesis CcdA family protein [Streptomyces sp. WAC00263]KAF5990674.1 cytochrome C biogenesis protein ResC [Streptomyces sp. WAC00263]